VSSYPSRKIVRRPNSDLELGMKRQTRKVELWQLAREYEGLAWITELYRHAGGTGEPYPSAMINFILDREFPTAVPVTMQAGSDDYRAKHGRVTELAKL
jgi:hypothetical protein